MIFRIIWSKKFYITFLALYDFQRMTTYSQMGTPVILLIYNSWTCNKKNQYFKKVSTVKLLWNDHPWDSYNSGHCPEGHSFLGYESYKLVF